MSLLVPDTGEVLMLERILNKTASDDLVIHLYTNDYTPVEASVVGDFTEETEGLAKTLTGASWTVSGSPTEASYAEQSFVLTVTADVYGFFMTDTAGTTLLWAERFSDAPYAVSGGGTIYVTPKIQLA